MLSTSQQVIVAYKIDYHRILASTLPGRARMLGVSIETQISEEQATPAKRGPTPKPQSHTERISRFPREVAASYGR